MVMVLDKAKFNRPITKSTRLRPRGSWAKDSMFEIGWKTETLFLFSYKQKKQSRTRSPPCKRIAPMPLLIVIFFFLYISFVYGSFFREGLIPFLILFSYISFFLLAGLGACRALSFLTVQALTSLDLICHIHSFTRHPFCQTCPLSIGLSRLIMYHFLLSFEQPVRDCNHDYLCDFNTL